MSSAVARGLVSPETGSGGRLVAVASVLPAVMFAVDMVMGYREGRPPRGDNTYYIDHWPTQAAMALTVAAVAVAVAARVRARWSGTAVSGGCVAVAAGWFGFWSLAYPDHAGSAGGAWGWRTWACAFAGSLGGGSRLATPTNASMRCDGPISQNQHGAWALAQV